MHNKNPAPTNRLRFVVLASSFGTLIEWYDFHLFGTLLTVMSQNFFPRASSFFSLIAMLITFAIGLAVRPLGSLLFGWIGDAIGRKSTFMITLGLMGGATAAIGILPTATQIGPSALVMLCLLRLLQGLAIGGEYAGAAVYVAENAPQNQRGLFTGFIQSTATVGLALAILVNLITQKILGVQQFIDWGWRIPYLLSVLLVIFSYYIRRHLNESPAFAQLHLEGKTSSNPILESFSDRENRMNMFLALVCAVAGQGVLWYTANFYSFYFMERILKIKFQDVNFILLISSVLSIPFFVIFGHLSDRYGRMRIILIGFFLAIMGLFPIYLAMFSIGGSLAFDPVSGNLITSAFLLLVGLQFLQNFIVSLVYGPLAAFLIDLFPIRIRYTSVSFPYHIGNGIFGGMVPLIGLLAITNANPLDAFSSLSGLYYPFCMVVMSFTLGIFFYRRLSKKSP